ncbi:putative glycoside hydrolase family 31 [Rosellinia necatrix]|uniref:Putative glycoside hydrolase family 31 n=1 Tax=Rosellinia necatrix TaxID=77044 RepID=A0A1W2TN74_ROSNE|nr:putative glycoside hydrolase family 31 [Rosellinia necatrix]
MDQSFSATPPLITLKAFNATIWGGFALCVVVFSSRVGIRVACFGRLFAEDYVMLVSLAALLGTAVIGQLYLGYIYDIILASDGSLPISDILNGTSKGLRSFAIFLVLNYTGVWLVKFNFLLFFRRLGNHVLKYLYFWWFVAVFNLASGFICIGLIDFRCSIPPADVVMRTCNSTEVAKNGYTATKVSAALDAIGDALIIGFPFWILWGCKLTIRKKLLLSSIFGLVAFTIAVTIIRGTNFGGAYIAEGDVIEVNIPWTWFWFNLEFIVAFTIGCLVSFRALFGLREKPKDTKDLEERRRRAALHVRSTSGGIRATARRMQEQLTTTFMTWEAMTTNEKNEGSEEYSLPCPPTGRLSLDFECGNTWCDPSSSMGSTSARATNVERTGSDTNAHATTTQ